MTPRLRLAAFAAGAVVFIGGGSAWWHERDVPRYLDREAVATFVATFAPPLAVDSSPGQAELAELRALARTRTAATVAAARADRKTEISRFYEALGLDAAGGRDLPNLERLAEYAEDDTRAYVRAAKRTYRRPRPYVVDPALEPCLKDVQDDLSYPSGHASYGYVMAYLLADMIPERRAALLERARQFARQRMVCGVHYPSDLDAGHHAAEWLVRRFLADPAYQRDAAAATRELRAALEGGD